MTMLEGAAGAIIRDTPKPFFDNAHLRSLLPVAVPLAMVSGMLFRGFDNAEGWTACSLINALTLICVLVLRPPPLSFWRQMRPLLILVGLAVLWLLIVQFGIPIIPFADRPVAFAPDMFVPALAGWLAGLYAFVIGALMALNRSDERRMMNMLLFSICGVLLIGLIVRRFGGQEALDYWSLSRQGRFAGTIGNANVTAVVAGMMTLLATGRILQLVRGLSGTPRERTVAVSLLCHGAAWLIAMVALISTASRAPILLTAVMLAVLAFRTFGKGPIDWRRWALYAAPALILIVVIGQADLLQQRLGSTSGEWSARLSLWAQYWDVVMLSPFYGYGLGGFQGINLFAMPSIRFAEGAWIVNSPHSIVLQLMVVGGIPYLLMMSAMAWRVVRATALHYAVVPWSILRWSVTLAIALALACAMIDIMLDVTSTIVLVLFLTGLLWGRGVSAIVGKTNSRP